MSRLTKRFGEVVTFNGENYKNTTAGEMTSKDIRCCLQKLCDYEDKDEQGLLLRLPCKVGENVYKIRVHIDFKEPVKEGTKISYKTKEICTTIQIFNS